LDYIRRKFLERSNQDLSESIELNKNSITLSEEELNLSRTRFMNKLSNSAVTAFIAAEELHPQIRQAHLNYINNKYSTTVCRVLNIYDYVEHPIDKKESIIK